MITKDDIDTIIQKSEKDKTALLKDILNWTMKAETAFEEKESAVKEVEEESETAEGNVIKLQNEHISRLESEKAELGLELKEVMKISDEVENLAIELEKARAATDTALKEKAEAVERIAKIQEQWEKISS